MASFLKSIADPVEVTTYIDSAILFPELLAERMKVYEPDIARFAEIVAMSASSAEVLEFIRSKNLGKDRRMPLLKIFRRCVSAVCDTERTKKMNIPTSD